MWVHLEDSSGVRLWSLINAVIHDLRWLCWWLAHHRFIIWGDVWELKFWGGRRPLDAMPTFLLAKWQNGCYNANEWSCRLKTTFVELVCQLCEHDTVVMVTHTCKQCLLCLSAASARQSIAQRNLLNGRCFNSTDLIALPWVHVPLCEWQDNISTPSCHHAMHNWNPITSCLMITVNLTL